MNRSDPAAPAHPVCPVDPAAIVTLAALRGITVPPVKFGNATTMVTRAGFVLDSADINDKHGFADGGCPDHILSMTQDWFNDDWVTIDSEVWHPVLFDLVRTRLLPAIGAPGLPIYQMSTLHNPIRIDADPNEVTVPAGTVTVDWMDLFARVVAAMPTQRILTDAERAAQEFGGF